MFEEFKKIPFGEKTLKISLYAQNISTRQMYSEVLDNSGFFSCVMKFTNVLDIVDAKFMCCL